MGRVSALVGGVQCKLVQASASFMCECAVVVFVVRVRLQSKLSSTTIDL